MNIEITQDRFQYDLMAAALRYIEEHAETQPSLDDVDDSLSAYKPHAFLRFRVGDPATETPCLCAKAQVRFHPSQQLKLSFFDLNGCMPPHHPTTPHHVVRQPTDDSCQKLPHANTITCNTSPPTKASHETLLCKTSNHRFPNPQ